MSTINFNDQYFPDYEILGKLGQSNAHVIKARHRATGEVVAIKHFPFNIDEGTLRRFRRESDLMNLLNHPNIVGIRSYHLDAELPHLVMEWVEGGDLRSLLKTNRTLSVPEVIRLGLQMTEALRIIHERGIIHRDIKPENILYRKLRSDEHQYLLTDFGVSRLRGQGRSTGITSMTYEYASPENFYDEENLSEASDFYSLGVVLYECLAGRVPFPLGSRGIGELMDRVRNTPLPELKMPEGIHLPPTLKKLIGELLEKKETNRLTETAKLKRHLKKAEWEWEGGEPSFIQVPVEKPRPVPDPSPPVVNDKPKRLAYQKFFWAPLGIMVIISFVFREKLTLDISSKYNSVKGKTSERRVVDKQEMWNQANELNEQKNYNEALQKYLTLAEWDADAQNQIGDMYRHGHGVEKDNTKAVEWYTKSAENGNSAAQSNLGFMYQYGLGVEKNYDQALLWHRKSADQNNKNAQYNLGRMHEKGQGVEQDFEMAKEWYGKAATQGHASAQRRLDRLMNTTVEDEDTMMIISEEDLLPSDISEYSKKTNSLNDKIFTVVEQNPEFPGGIQEMYKFLSKHIRFPIPAFKSNIQGKVFLSFIVNKDGSIQDIVVVKGLGFGCDEEAIRVVKSMPRWKPGMQSGQSVRVKYNLPISFQLE